MNDGTTATLRERRAESLRASLRRAFIELVLERGGTGFSLHDVAAAAGVSDRTLYRYYPSREALVEAVTTEEVAELEHERRDDIGDPRIFGDTEWAADAFELFERHADLMRAIRMLRASGHATTATATRTRLVRQRVASVGVDPSAVEQLTALLRLVAGSDGWARMREPDLDLEPREAGYAAHWAAQVLVDAARQVRGPLRPRLEE